MSIWKIAVGVALGGVLLLVLFIAALGTLDMYSQVKACGGWDAWRSAFEIRPENPVPVCIAEKERVAREAREERKQEQKEQAKRAGEVILNQPLNEDRNKKQSVDADARPQRPTPEDDRRRQQQIQNLIDRTPSAR